MLKTLIKIATSGTIGKIVKPIMEALTPEIRAFIVKWWFKLKEKTDATPNEADDCITDLIQDLLGITDQEAFDAVTSETAGDAE